MHPSPPTPMAGSPLVDDLSLDPFRDQHKLRISWMPWLYFSLKPRHRGWAKAWQDQVKADFERLETVHVGEGCFLAPTARLFGEPGRPVIIGDGCAIAAEAFVHGPVTLGKSVSLNARAAIDGGSKGVRIGDDTRIATGVAIYAFDHGIHPDRLVREQPVKSNGVVIGTDVWIGANACITDGVTIGDHAVVGMGAVVTRDVEPWAIVGGVPARVVGDRRNRT